MPRRDKQPKPTPEQRYGPSLLLTPEEFSHHGKKSLSWTFKALKSGRLTGIRLGGAWRIPRSALGLE